MAVHWSAAVDPCRRVPRDAPLRSSVGKPARAQDDELADETDVIAAAGRVFAKSPSTSWAAWSGRPIDGKDPC